VYSDRLEREREHQLRRVRKDTGSPIRLPDRESPLRRAETWIELANLDDSDCGLTPAGDNGKTNVGARGPLRVRPRDKPFESFDGRGRGNESCDLFR
jgi:hypothetical protein